MDVLGELFSKGYVYMDAEKSPKIRMLRIIETEDDSNVKTKKVVVDALKDFYTMKFGSKEKIESTGKIDIGVLKKYVEKDG